MPFSYANPVSGPSAGGIGWFDFGTFTLVNGGTATTFSGTLNDGTTVTFDIDLVPVSGTPRNFGAVTVPTFPGSNFGATGYTGIPGNVALNSILTVLPGVNTVNISNIVVTDINNNPVSNYTAILADSERTNIGEIWNWQTDGGNWDLLATLGANPPALAGLGTQSATITGLGLVSESAYVLTSQTPTSLALTLTSPISSRQAFSLGFATTRVRVQKNIAGRADPADQFELNIGGTPSDTVTTTGATSGLQTPIANVFAIPATTYSISEAMAPGSVSPLSAYTQVVSASNATPAGSVPPTGSLPINFTPVLGDDVTYTIFNIAPQEFTKTVDKAYADLGDILTYTVGVENPNNFAINNVLVTDAIPPGTTFVPGSLIVSQPYTGTAPDTGITITTIPANTTATLTWQVQVNSLPPISNPVTNVAMVTVPGGTSGPTNAVTTQVNTAYVTIIKSSNPAFANLGDTITYTLDINNAGNVPATNVNITDAIPAGTTFVPGSVTGATGTPPNLTLLAPIPAGGNTMVTFQVVVGANFPVPNPIPNSATTAYTYTVDPAFPNAATGTAASNTALTLVNAAVISSIKSVDKAFGGVGEVLTYTITLNNTGNVPASNVIITDAIPAGTTFVAGSVTGATGTPPTLTVPNPIPAGGSAVVTFQVVVDNAIPVPNPVPNAATVAFDYTTDPNFPLAESGTSATNTVNTFIAAAIVTTVKNVDKSYVNVGDTITYTITLTNSGSVAANNVVITDNIPAGTTFINGTLFGATGTPPTLTVPNPIPAGGSVVVTFQVLVGNTIPVPNPLENIATAAFTYTADPNVPNGESGTSASNLVQTVVNSAIISTVKSVDKAFANIGDIITYTITVNNSGNVTANNVVITDAIPAGVEFVPGSVTGATGAPPTLTLANPIAAGGTVVVTYKVKVVGIIAGLNPVENTASVAFSYTVDPSMPNGETAISYSNIVETQLNTAKLEIVKSVDKAIAYIGDVITYQIAVTNTGNTAANNVVITDLINAGLSYVPGSLVVSAPSSGDPTTAITLTNPIAAGQTVTITFQATVVTIPNPNPALNVVTSTFTYTVDPLSPNGVTGSATSNVVSTIVFRFNFGQQISDLIESVALEQAALAAIANAEGAKIQKIAAMPGVTTKQLLCLNKSVSAMTDSITLLESVLKQKLGVVSCQINGETTC